MYNNNQQKIGRFGDLSLFPFLTFLFILTLSYRVIWLTRVLDLTMRKRFISFRFTDF